MALNRTILQGNLIRTPETRDVGDGNKVCRMVLAVDRQGRKRDNTNQPPQCFEIEAWGQKAELCQTYLEKGSPVIVEGHLQQDRWMDTQTNQARTKIIIKVDNIEFLRDGRTKPSLETLETSPNF